MPQRARTSLCSIGDTDDRSVSIRICHDGRLIEASLISQIAGPKREPADGIVLMEDANYAGALLGLAGALARSGFRRVLLRPVLLREHYVGEHFGFGIVDDLLPALSPPIGSRASTVTPSASKAGARGGSRRAGECR